MSNKQRFCLRIRGKNCFYICIKTWAALWADIKPFFFFIKPVFKKCVLAKSLNSRANCVIQVITMDHTHTVQVIKKKKKFFFFITFLP